MVPIAPILALFVAVTIDYLTKYKWSWILVTIGVVEAVLNQQHDFFIPKEEKYKLELEAIMDDHVPKSSLIGINSTSENHQLMYLAHRKGWMILNEEVLKPNVLSDHKSRGCEFLVIDKHIQEHKPLLELIHEDENFSVYKM